MDDTTEHHQHCMCRACYWQRRTEKAETQRDALLKKLQATSRTPEPPVPDLADVVATLGPPCTGCALVASACKWQGGHCCDNCQHGGGDQRDRMARGEDQ